jgi:hypothetical protein
MSIGKMVYEFIRTLLLFLLVVYAVINYNDRIQKEQQELSVQKEVVVEGYMPVYTNFKDIIIFGG